MVKGTYGISWDASKDAVVAKAQYAEAGKYSAGIELELDLDGTVIAGLEGLKSKTTNPMLLTAITAVEDMIKARMAGQP